MKPKLKFDHRYFIHRPGYIPSGEYLFVSTVSGFNPKVGASLQQILDGSTIPKIIFWLGDVSATRMLTNLENIFNDIRQTMKKLLKQNPKPSDEDILKFPIKDDLLLADICRQLRDMLKKLDPTYSQAYTANLAWLVSRSKNFNQFIDNLYPIAQKKIQNDQAENAVDYIHLMTQFAKKGSQVIIVEGDKDTNCPLDFQFKKNVAHTSKKIQYVDQSKVIKTDDCIFVVWPYNSQPSDIPYLNNPTNKTVVIVSHSPFIYEAVMGGNPFKDELEYMTKRDEEIDSYMMNVVGQLGATYGVHGHLHRPIDCGKYDAYNVSFMVDRGQGYFSAYFVDEGIRAIDF